MPGAVEPTFGSRLVDAIVSVGLASVLVTALSVSRGALASPSRFALAGGVAYALACLGTYFLPRFLMDAFLSGVFAPQYLAWLLLLVGPLLVAQGAVPVYLAVDRGAVGALGGLLVATALTLWVFLSLGGETDVLALYPFVVFPVAAAVVALSVGADLAVRATTDLL